jgi:hypothetical protein
VYASRDGGSQRGADSVGCAVGCPQRASIPGGSECRRALRGAVSCTVRRAVPRSVSGTLSLVILAILGRAAWLNQLDQGISSSR